MTEEAHRSSSLKPDEQQNESDATRRFDSNDVRSSLLRPGSVLRQRYRLESEIGRGGMGIVYRAMDLELMRPVAVKVLPEKVSASDMRERFFREARAAAALNHPHIVAVHDVGEDHGFPFFVMELVVGPSLDHNYAADLREVVEIACQICDALEHAHANQIVHRDLKPENILLSTSSNHAVVKLADLGLALPAHGSRISRAGTIVGTAAYMAPEQALGKKVDGRADLYALGVMLYQLTTGRLPFISDDPLGTISQHVHAPVVRPRALRPDLPLRIEAVILRLLAKDPEHRFSTAAETAKALRDAYEARESPDNAEAPAAVAILDVLARGRLIGRAEELAEARELWRRSQEGRGHCLLISGEPGAGKTRLARELIVQASLDGAAILNGACYEYEATTPYLPFVESFRRWVREVSNDTVLRDLLGDSAPLLSKLAPEIGTRLGPFSALQEFPPHEERLLFFDAVSRFLANLARKQGLVFYVDDLHWADSSSLWLLSHLIRSLRDERMLILASYRDTELDRAHPLAKALVDWNRERLVTRINLKRFGPDETAAQLAALLGENISQEFTEAVYRETEGNPFFVEEVMKALIESGSVRRESGKWQRCEMKELVIPQSVKEAIGHRLDRVSADCNEVLRAAAVLGKTFTYEELSLAALNGKGEDALLDALDEAVAAQLLASDRDEQFLFTHDKIREVLYEELNPIRRRRLHKRTAEGLEQLRQTRPVAVETLAHHYIQAGEYERGLHYAKQAALEAERVFAFDEAIAAYGRALECAESLELEQEKLFLEEAAGNAAMLAGNTLQAAEHFERALSLATTVDDRARLQCQVAGSLVTNGEPRGEAYAREAEAVLDPVTQPIETANAIAIQARFKHLAGEHEQTLVLLERAAQLIAPFAAEKELDAFAKSIISTVYGWLAGAYQHLGRYSDGNEWARRSVEFGETHRAPVAQALGYEFLGENSISAGFWQSALEYAAKEREIIAKLHSRERLAWTYLVTSLSYSYAGDLEKAEQDFRAGIELSELIGERRLASMLTGNLGITLADRGLLDEALELARRNRVEADSLGLLYSQTEARRSLAYIHFRRGELAESLRLCEEILEMVGEKSRVSRLWLGPLHIEVLFRSGRREEALAHLKSYEELLAQCQTPRFEREAARLRKAICEGSN